MTPALTRQIRAAVKAALAEDVAHATPPPLRCFRIPFTHVAQSSRITR